MTNSSKIKLVHSLMLVVLVALVLKLFINVHDSHLKRPCQLSAFEELTYYDPTLGSHEAKYILMQLSHPTVAVCPAPWFAWVEQPIDKWERHNEYHHWNLPMLSPPIRLSDGTFANSIFELEEVRTNE
jgi:hypothetical protein